MTELQQEGEIDLLKEAEHQDTDGDGVVEKGEKILYRFTVENIGNVTLTDISVEDDKAVITGGPLTSLQPGSHDATTFTGEYTIAQEDVDAGFLENVAMAKGLDPANVEVTARSHGPGGEAGDATSFVIPSSAALQLFKTGSFEPADDINGNGFPDPGELVRFKFKVVNSGNVTLSNITINDPDASIAGGPIASLPAAQSDTVTFTGTHVLTLDEVNAGQAINQATVHGVAPNGTTASDLSDDPENTANEDIEGDGEPDDPTVVRLLQNPSLLAEKSGSFQGAPSGTANPGDTILYQITVTNTGSVTVYDVSPMDPGPTFGGRPATGTLTAFSPNKVDLDPGEKGHFSATYTLTSEDLSNAQNSENGVQNSATATGTGPKGQNAESPPSEPATVTLPGYLITKIADVSEVQRGESLFYTISLKSIGQTVPTMVDVVDEIPASFVYAPGSTTLDGEVLTPEIEGRRLIFRNVTLQPDKEREIRLEFSVSPTAEPDSYTNRGLGRRSG
ncbi:hypothetical protein AB2N04_10470 [Nitratireductor sp. GISD-1A_MAKvit]|uniref:DUF7507 domain-containing protein n=1 Tax=Nitratireductor sp. GISD-1A_MAKvit TaxID=3234198 RepID=UPI003466C7DF